ncbi:MAG TPA: hypothetical protein VFQ45_14830 [Longimicrobium sp.]|nr:hypothetical protein [Longimicrobium sp.]
MSRILAIPLLALGTACGAGDGSGARIREPASPLAALTAETLRVVRGTAQRACGPAPEVAAVQAVYLTADKCLSCLEIGAMMRELTRDAAAPGQTVVVAPAGHAGEVCGYLRREKVKVPVYAIPGSRLGRSGPPGDLVYFRLDAAGRLLERIAAFAPSDLTERLARISAMESAADLP